MIKNLINKLFQQASQTKQDKSRINTEFIPTNNSVMFWIGDDGQPYLKIYIVDTKVESIVPLADMLYSINTGQHMQSILNLLVNMSKQDANINTYIISLINEWQSFIDNDLLDYSDNEPHVKPTAFHTAINNNDE